jgi:hypothetical protein
VFIATGVAGRRSAVETFLVDESASIHCQTTMRLLLFLPFFLLTFVEAAPIFLPRRQLLNTLSVTYGPPSSASSPPSKIYLSSPSLALDCPIVPILIAGLYPPFSLVAVSSPV